MLKKIFDMEAPLYVEILFSTRVEFFGDVQEILVYAKNYFFTPFGSLSLFYMISRVFGCFQMFLQTFGTEMAFKPSVLTFQSDNFFAMAIRGYP